MALQQNYTTTAPKPIRIPASPLLPLVQRGWHLLPISPTSKHPLYKASQTNSARWGCSNDLAYLEKLFARQRSRDAHVGVATGPESGIFVVDIDTVKGHGESADGHASLRKLIEKYGPLPSTLTALTPSGGEHFYFRYPGDGRKAVSRALRDEHDKKIDGIDIKGYGGYVVTVPSKGRVWLDAEAPIVEAPDWLLDLVCEKPEVAVRIRKLALTGPGTVRKNRWRWRPPEFTPRPPPAPVNADPEILAMMREDSGLGLPLDPRDYEHLMDTPLLRLRHALAVIPNTGSDYDEWIKMGASIYNLVGDAGFELFDEWSSKSPAYDPAFTEFKWYQPGGICSMSRLEGGSKVFFHANQHDKERIWQLRWLVELEQQLYRELGL